MRARLLFSALIVAAFARNAVAADNVAKKLNAPISVECQDRPLTEVIDDLRAVSGVEIVPDIAALERAGIPLSQPLSARAHDVSLRTALRQLLKPAKLTFVISDEIVRIEPMSR